MDEEGEKLVPCDLIADFSLQQWYYEQSDQPVATLAFLPRELSQVKSVVELYFKLGEGIDLFFQNPVTDVLEAITTDAHWLAAFKVCSPQRVWCGAAHMASHSRRRQEWDKTKGDRRLNQLIARLQSLGRFLLTAMHVFAAVGVPPDAPGHPMTAPARAATAQSTRSSLGSRVSRRSSDGSVVTISTLASEATGKPLLDMGNAIPAAGAHLRPLAQRSFVVSQHDLVPIRHRRYEEYLSSLPPNRHGTLATLSLPVWTKASEAKKGTPKEWFAMAWDVAEEVHTYAAHRRLHPYIVDHVLKPLADMVTFLNTKNVVMPAAISTLFARVRGLHTHSVHARAHAHVLSLWLHRRFGLCAAVVWAAAETVSVPSRTRHNALHPLVGRAVLAVVSAGAVEAGVHRRPPGRLPDAPRGRLLPGQARVAPGPRILGSCAHLYFRRF